MPAGWPEKRIAAGSKRRQDGSAIRRRAPHRRCEAGRQEAVVDRPSTRAVRKNSTSPSARRGCPNAPPDDDEQSVLDAGDAVVAEDRPSLRGRIVIDAAAVAVPPRPSRPCRRSGLRRYSRASAELDPAVLAQADLAALGEAGDALDHEGVAVLVGVVGEQHGRIDDEGPVLERAQAVIVGGPRRVVERPDPEIVGQRRRRTAGVGDVVGDARRSQADGVKVTRPASSTAGRCCRAPRRGRHAGRRR